MADPTDTTRPPAAPRTGGPARRGYLGAAVKSALEFIDQRGLTQAIRADASPAVRAQMDAPPGMMSWQDSAVLDELETLLARHAGAEACVSLGLYAARKLGGGLIQPVLRFALQLFGNSPATLLGNLDRFYPMVTRGLTYGYEAISETEGVVILTAEGAGIPPALFDVTRGNLGFLLEMTGATGTVAPPHVRSSDDQATVVDFVVSWG
ncbi:MAG: hypothetical protein NVSMB23_09130 [Myxococcales bacterium]